MVARDGFGQNYTFTIPFRLQSQRWVQWQYSCLEAQKLSEGVKPHAASLV
jgi:hypothetical protein